MSADEEFVDFVSTTWARLYRLAYLLSGNRANAEDLLQTAMEKTYARWPTVRRMEAPEAYVRVVIVNALVSSRRRPAWRREWLRESVLERPLPAPEMGVVDHALVWPLVCSLPPRQRAVIVLRYYEDLTEAQTAEVLGCTVGTVKSQAHDAMRALRRGLVAVDVTGEVASES